MKICPNCNRRSQITGRIILALIIATVVLIVAMSLYREAIVPRNQYNRAQKLMDDGKYQEAIELYEGLDGYRDSEKKIPECKYCDAIDKMNAGQYEEALAILESLGDYNDSEDKIIECRYDYAIDLMNAEQYEDALALFESLGDYNDSTDRFVECEIGIISTCSAGDTVRFGNYDGNTEWRVIYHAGSRYILISSHIVDERPFDSYSNDWSSSDLRAWLNDSYYFQAFTGQEQDMIEQIGDDKVSVLSISEARMYFTGDGDRQAISSDLTMGYISCSWWLRSPCTDNSVAYVCDDGDINDCGWFIDFSDSYPGYGTPGYYVQINRGVRPIIYINLES